MIIIRILNNRVTKVIKGDADVIVQNSLRANDVFFIFENATDGKTAEVYFERRKADNSIETIGGFVATPTTKTLRMAIDDGQAAQERLWSGFYYKFNTKEITRVATDNLTIGLKVYDYDENDERREIASVSTILQVVPSAITPSPILSITAAQLEALYSAINALNQPIVDLSRVFDYDTSVSSQYVASYIFDNTTDTEGIYNVGGRLFVKSVGYIVATPNTYDKGGVYGYNEVEGVKVAYLLSDGEVKVGILNNLLTNDKTSLVMAINEVIQSTFKLDGNNTITGYNQYNQKQWFNDGMEVNGDASFSEGDVDFNGNVSFNKRVTTPKDVIVNDSEGHAGKSTFTSLLEH